MPGILARFFRPGPAPLPEAHWLVVGLGNPGEKYASTRHNVGYMAVEEALEQLGCALRPVRGIKTHLAFSGGVAYARPTTYMNESGRSVGPLAQRLSVPAQHIVVLHDELDLPPGTVRLRRGGSENGHNGLKSLSEHLGTRDYIRVRIGIGRPPTGTAVPEWVLSPIDGAPAAQIATAAKAAHLVVTEGLSKAQNVIHSR